MASCRPRVWRVLALSAAVGFVVSAFARPMWTDNVESAQLLAGVVSYPSRTPMYDYHTSVYSLTIQPAALLLRLGVPEWPLSVVSSGLQGALAFAALSMLALTFSRHPTLALAAPFLILRLREWCETETSYIGVLHGHRYPNVFPNHVGIYGVVGLFSLMLVLGLFGVKKVRAAAFLLGLMPGVHMGLAIPAFVGVAAAGLWMGRERRVWWRAGWRPMAAGMGVVAVTAGVHVAFFRDPAPPISAPGVTDLMHAFLARWDDHNFLLAEHERLTFFESEYYTLALGLAFLTFLRRHMPRRARGVTVALLAIVIVAVAYTLFLNWRPDLVPWPVRTLLITRWLNLSSLAFPVLGLGVLADLAFRRRNAFAAAVLLFEAVLVATGYTQSLTAASMPGGEGMGAGPQGLVFPVSLMAGAIVLPLLDRTRFTLRHPRIVSHLLSAGAGVLCVLQLSLASHLGGIDGERLRGRDAYTDVFEAARGRPGFLLVCDALWDAGRVQLRTRRPLLIDQTQLNMFLKVPASAPAMAEILADAYGVDVFTGGPNESLDAAWQDFTLEKWQQLRRERGVTDVLVSGEQELPLPKVFEGTLTLYTIPW